MDTQDLAAAGPLRLDPRLDLRAAGPLAAALRGRKAGPLDIDAGKVVHLGALCLQVLAAAGRDWTTAGMPFRIAPRSVAFDACVADFGLCPDRFAAGEAA
jgi:chemotaxis protein CheX